MNSVIKLSVVNSIGYVCMEDREYRNTFSLQFVSGLKETFAYIAQNPQIKVVIIHGYDNYFSCGGTKEELIGLYEGVGKTGAEKVQFDDLKFHDLLLKCEVPVIAAMQGHAIGGGLAFGSFADIIVLAEEAIYNAVFMKYGFTPGMGATYMIPKKFGTLLGHEMLYTAKNYYGRELKERGAPAKIVSKRDVISAAEEIAEELIDKPIGSLKLLKKHLTQEIYRELPLYIEKELHMHEISFAQAEVRERIESKFGK
ncbi:MAG: polyketide synthase [Clostridia bacterium]|nr:polyketide synthase [Clostridia bacterium]